MNLMTHSSKQIGVFALLLILTCIMLTFVMLTTVAHINVGHLFTAFVPSIMNGFY